VEWYSITTDALGVTLYTKQKEVNTSVNDKEGYLWGYRIKLLAKRKASLTRR
jgi:hypothetical protein